MKKLKMYNVSYVPSHCTSCGSRLKAMEYTSGYNPEYGKPLICTVLKCTNFFLGFIHPTISFDTNGHEIV